ncbi:VOC family protein [Rhizorhabdus dicambivorans]|uniref:VOC family protein n=1 Tax=Rhizorhabdus dicambivorans TaxID=1850238 RepID=A0A2A4FYI7_9SPHN|nr:VOC family protein [Rhizorhabdus dicambivorans]ATE63308.1 VOC family protein [Rhizorhabdus dicambivorans]PCE43522.1 VOC family protein [Rhizorhabdus dicambivorans]
MFSHVMVGTGDLEASKRFYDSVLGTLGVKPGRVDTERNRIFWMSPNGMFGVTRPIDGEPPCHANGGTIGFAAASPEQADQWHAAGVANGGTSCEDPPGVRDMGAFRLYLAYLRDPDGNKLCAMHRLS